MFLDIEPTEGGFRVVSDGRERVLIDDLHLTVWGERQRLAAGEVHRHLPTREPADDELGPHELDAFGFTTLSLRHPAQYRLMARAYRSEPVLLLELQPQVSQPVFGTEEAAVLRIAALPGCRRAVFYHLEVSEYGRTAYGSWWAHATWLPDPTRENLRDWGIGCAWQTDDDRHAVLLPMRGGGAVSRLRGTEMGLELVASGWCGRHVYPRLPLGLLVIDEDPHAAIDRAFRAAARLCEWSFRLRGEKAEPVAFDHLGYCTWGAMGAELTERRVFAALQSLRDAGVPVRWALLEEGWQQTNSHQQLVGYGADSARLPSGLEAAVQRLRGETGLRHVGVWLTLQGSWCGIDPTSRLATEHPERFETGLDGCRVPSPYPAGQAFWDEWFARLGRAGVDFVRVDNQGSGRNLWLGKLPIDAGVGGCLYNLEQAARSVPLDLIASMSHQPECFYHCAVTNVIRAAPEVAPEDTRAAKLHVAHALTVGGWLSRIAWPDHDAFPSTHRAARAFAVAAAMSGGPVAIADRPGEHNLDLLRRLCLRDGTLLRPEAPALVPASRFYANPLADDVPLVVQARAGRVPRRRPSVDVDDGWDRVVPPLFVAVFNLGLGGYPLHARIELRELDLPPADGYAVWAHFAADYRVLRPGEALEVALGELEAELFTMAPIESGRALLGLREKLLGACGCRWESDDLLSLPEPGVALLYDEAQREPCGIEYEPYPVYEGPRSLGVGEAWRDGPWLTVHAPSNLFRVR